MCTFNNSSPCNWTKLRAVFNLVYLYLRETWNGDEIYRKKSNKTSTGIAISGEKKEINFSWYFSLNFNIFFYHVLFKT